MTTRISVKSGGCLPVGMQTALLSTDRNQTAAGQIYPFPLLQGVAKREP